MMMGSFTSSCPLAHNVYGCNAATGMEKAKLLRGNNHCSDAMMVWGTRKNDTVYISGSQWSWIDMRMGRCHIYMESRVYDLGGRNRPIDTSANRLLAFQEEKMATKLIISISGGYDFNECSECKLAKSPIRPGTRNFAFFACIEYL